jgi:hypothetical protein
MRQSWNFRMYARARPHTLQRLRIRTANFSFLGTISTVFATS